MSEIILLQYMHLACTFCGSLLKVMWFNSATQELICVLHWMFCWLKFIEQCNMFWLEVHRRYLKNNFVISVIIILFAHGITKMKTHGKYYMNVIYVTRAFDVLCFRKFIGEYIEAFLLLGHSILHTRETKKINAMSM